MIIFGIPTKLWVTIFWYIYIWYIMGLRWYNVLLLTRNLHMNYMETKWAIISDKYVYNKCSPLGCLLTTKLFETYKMFMMCNCIANKVSVTSCQVSLWAPLIWPIKRVKQKHISLSHFVPLTFTCILYFYLLLNITMCIFLLLNWHFICRKKLI